MKKILDKIIDDFIKQQKVKNNEFHITCFVRIDRQYIFGCVFDDIHDYKGILYSQTKYRGVNIYGICSEAITDDKIYISLGEKIEPEKIQFYPYAHIFFKTEEEKCKLPAIYAEERVKMGGDENE